MEMIETKMLSERFEAAFNLIHEHLRRMTTARTDKFSSLVRYARYHKAIETYQDELLQYAKLRNAMVHEKTIPGFYIAEPHQQVVERIEKIAAILSKPNYALTIASKDIVWFDAEDSLEEVIQKMKDCPFSQFPVYQARECIGLLTTRGIVNWMAVHIARNQLDLNDVKIGDVLGFEEEHPIEFAAKRSNIFEVEDIFENHHRKKEDLEMVIITERGLDSETPLGIVTAWDLIEIDYTAD